MIWQTYEKLKKENKIATEEVKVMQKKIQEQEQIVMLL
jgi:hypothetical protein